MSLKPECIEEASEVISGINILDKTGDAFYEGIGVEKSYTCALMFYQRAEQHLFMVKLFLFIQMRGVIWMDTVEYMQKKIKEAHQVYELLTASYR